MKVEVVMDKGKARARAETGAWVRFPNNLREVGAVFDVVGLTEGKGGCLVVGSRETISPVNKIAREVLASPLW